MGNEFEDEKWSKLGNDFNDGKWLKMGNVND